MVGSVVCTHCGLRFQPPPAGDLSQPSTVRLVSPFSPARGTNPDEGRLVPTVSALKSNGETATPNPPTQPAFDFLSPAHGPGEIGRLGPYRILDVLGAGGMGVVFRAEDPRLRRRVALKVITPSLASDHSARQRFLREARAAAAVEHDNVVAVHQIGEDGDIPFVAMPLLKGESLATRFQRQEPLPVPEVIRIGSEIARGLEAIHAHGLIHRDIKPGNIWLEEPGGRVKIFDFGLVYSFGEEAELTQAGAAMGTPTYMAPEQSGGPLIDHRADLFSLGCVLYRAATGKMPFRTPEDVPLPTAMAVHEAAPPHTLRPELPAELAGLIARLVTRDRQERPASAREVAEALESLGRALPPEPKGGIGRSRPRRLVFLSAIPAAAILAVAGAALHVATDRGTLEIDSLDPGVKVVIERDGRPIQTVDPGTTRELKLRSGEYTFRPETDRKDVEVRPDRVTLRRGESAVIKVKPVGPEAEWAAGVAALPAEQQHGEVAARLRKLNPEFNGHVDPTIEDGVVVGLHFYTDNVTNLRPVRALRGLTSLAAIGRGDGKGRLADLSPLEGLPLTELRCGNNPVSDLTPLTGMRLKVLTVGNSRVEDLGPLKGMPLVHLDFYGNRVIDLEPLRGMETLDYLNCANNPDEADLEPLRGLSLTGIYCDRAEQHLDLLRSLKSLKTIQKQDADKYWENNGGR